MLIKELAEEKTFENFGFLKEICSGIEHGLTVQEAWMAAAVAAPFFSGADRETIGAVGTQLGETDTEGQISMLSVAESMLSHSLESAEKEYERKARAVMGAWVFCGIGAGIIII